MTVPCEEEKTQMSAGLIRQEHDYGCGIACLAMVTGQTYAAVHDELLAAIPGRDFAERGIHQGIVHWYLSTVRPSMWRTITKFGPENTQTVPWPPEPFAPIHICSVVQPSRNQHFVVMRGDGVVLDPLSDAPTRLDAWDDINNVMGVWSALSQSHETPKGTR